MLKKIPRPVFILNYYLYPIMAVMILLAMVMGFAHDGISVGELSSLFSVGIGTVLVWWVFHARQSKDLPDSVRTQLWRLHPYTLLAFESEYCPVCMTLSNQIVRLETSRPDSLKIYHLSVNREPGQTLFKQFDGRVTPTYVLLNSAGQVIMDWPLVLPIERVLYAVAQV